MKRTLIAAALLVPCLCAMAYADTWAYPPKVTKHIYDFGRSKVVLEVDARQERRFPPHTLCIYYDGVLAAKYGGVGFTRVFASKDRRYFVGLSNHGIPGTAFVVFDSRGNLIREQKHRFMPAGVHTVMSATLDKVWFDTANPEVKFEIEGDRLIGVLVRGSNKQQYNLLKTDLGFDGMEGFGAE